MSEGGVKERASRVIVVERHKLLAHLESHRDVPIVVIHAGAGFGKTVLAAQ